MDFPSLCSLVRTLLDGVTYREGWKFEFLEEKGVVQVTWRVPDVNGPGTAFLVSQFGIDMYVGLRQKEVVNYFMHELWVNIERLEGHERLELLQFQGKPVWNPHPLTDPNALYPSPLVCGPHGPTQITHADAVVMYGR